MVKPRIVETIEGIQGQEDVRSFDVMLRHLRDKGWMETESIIKSGIKQGEALEIGPGPGYLGLEWLKRTEGTHLTAVEISEEMIKTAQKNAGEYGLTARVRYVKSDAQKLPFPDGLFNGVFSNGSLHEWAFPENIFNEIHRVLKKGGRYFISDLRRDINPFWKWFLRAGVKPREMKAGLLSSLNASYTEGEIKKICERTGLKEAAVRKTFLGLEITGMKK